MATWDPEIVGRAIAMQNLMMDIGKTIRQDNPPAVKSTIQTPVQPVQSPQTPNTVKRVFERLDDPPSTVLRFKNEMTGEIERQIPSEVSIQIYKQMAKFLQQVEERQNEAEKTTETNV